GGCLGRLRGDSFCVRWPRSFVPSRVEGLGTGADRLDAAGFGTGSPPPRRLAAQRAMQCAGRGRSRLLEELRAGPILLLRLIGPAERDEQPDQRRTRNLVVRRDAHQLVSV